MRGDADAIRVLDEWYCGLRQFQDGLPSKGSIAAALHVLNRLRSDFDLRVEAHVASGEAQITGLSAAAIQKILAEFGETRVLSAIGGRSNRGGRGDVAKLLDLMQQLHLHRLSEAKRVSALKRMQQHIVTDYVTCYFALRRVKAVFDGNASTRQIIQAIIENAKASGKAGAVAEHLVGAKLALKFPDIAIRNKRFSTSDVQGGFGGDFEVGNTIFHVTVAPMPELVQKCRDNLERGHRVYLIVPESLAVGTRQNAEAIARGRIAVESIESFVGTNVDEFARFGGGSRLKSEFRRLLETYNARVDAVELDKSLLIDIPPNLD